MLSSNHNSHSHYQLINFGEVISSYMKTNEGYSRSLSSALLDSGVSHLMFCHFRREVSTAKRKYAILIETEPMQTAQPLHYISIDLLQEFNAIILNSSLKLAQTRYHASVDTDYLHFFRRGGPNISYLRRH